jgi:POT family proton-dependent oligopeptide transporter
MWFLSSSWAQFIGGFVAQMAGTETVGGRALDPALALRTYLGVFSMIGWVGVGSGITYFLLSPILRRWAHGADDVIAEPPAKLTPAVRPAE